MDATSFDRIVRSFGFRGSRRSAIGLALAASGWAASGADAARCSQTDPCPECQRCRKRT